MSNTSTTATNLPSAPVATVIAPIKAKDNVFSPHNADEILAEVSTSSLDKAKPGTMNICTQYYDFVLNVPIRGVFLGITTTRTVNQQTGEEVELDAAVFIDQTNTIFVNSAVKFVSALAQLPSKTPFQATWTGTKKTSNGGQMRLFTINLLK